MLKPSAAPVVRSGRSLRSWATRAAMNEPTGRGSARYLIARATCVVVLLALTTAVRAEAVGRSETDLAPRSRVIGIALASLASAAALGGSIAELDRPHGPQSAMSDLDGNVRAVIGGVLVGVGVGLLGTAIALGVQYARGVTHSHVNGVSPVTRQHAYAPSGFALHF